jgi:HPt (histidine-containing phosphotransfer) domain-containing protein
VDAEPNDVEAIREHLRNVLRDVNQLCSDIEHDGLPEGTHALASALRSRLGDLSGAIDGVLGTTDQPGRTAAGASGASGAGPAPVDEQVLNNLLEDLGDASRVSYLVQLFLTELHGRRQALTTAADQSDVAAAKGVAHTLKSSALLLGANGLGHACESLSVNESPSALRGLVDDVLQQATAAARWFQIWLSNQPVNP